jgi:hypothetical protein
MLYSLLDIFFFLVYFKILYTFTFMHIILLFNFTVHMIDSANVTYTIR